MAFHVILFAPYISEIGSCYRKRSGSIQIPKNPRQAVILGLRTISTLRVIPQSGYCLTAGNPDATDKEIQKAQSTPLRAFFVAQNQSPCAKGQLIVSEGKNGHRPVVCRGVRGATTVTENTKEAILEATRDLLLKIIAVNHIELDDIASTFFSTTPDVTAEYPALAARQIGWHDVALMCGHEMNVPTGLKYCIRVLIHWNTTLSPSEIQHVYIRGAVNLRPDRSIQIVDAPFKIESEEKEGNV